MSDIKCPDPNCNYQISAEIAELALGKHVLHDHPWSFTSGSKKGDHEVPQFRFQNRDEIKRWLEESNQDEIKQWLDGKWEIETPDKKLQDTDFCVKFDFRNPNEPGKKDVDTLYWIDFMIILDKFEQHRHLLKHPLFTSLIYSQRKINASSKILCFLKWMFAYLSLTIVMMFAYMYFFGQSLRASVQDANMKITTELIGLNATTVQLEDYYQSNWTKCNNNSDIYFIPIVFDETSKTLQIFVIIIGITVILTIKHSIHVYMAIWNLEILNLFKNLEFWMETVFIGLSIALISEALYPNQVFSRCEGIRLRGVVATMLLIRCIVCLELLLQLFEHAKALGVIRTAFKKIFWNCFCILSFIIPYTASFSLFFYVALHNDYGTQEKNTTNLQNQTDEIQREENGLSDYFTSYLKTFVMFVGELDFSNIPFENSPVFSYPVFIVFLLVIIVLMNLLTGLAVVDMGDMAGMEEDAYLRTEMNRAWVIRGMLKTYPLIVSHMFSSFKDKKDGHWTSFEVNRRSSYIMYIAEMFYFLPKFDNMDKGRLKKSLENYMNKKNIKELYLEHDLVRDSIKNYSTTLKQKLATLDAQQVSWGSLIPINDPQDTKGVN